MDDQHARLLRFSLVLVWVLTALVSVWELDGQSRQLLQQGGVGSADASRWLVLAGAAVDLLLGLALLFKPGRWVYRIALGAMLGMTLVATVLIPALWLHPLGPLLKNIPIAAVLFVLAREHA